MEIITMEINFFTFIILGILYLIFVKGSKTKKNKTYNSRKKQLDDMKKRLEELKKGQERREKLITLLDAKEKYEKEYPSEFGKPLLMEEWDPEGYKELMKTKKNYPEKKEYYSFPDNLETKKLKKNLKHISRNVLLKKLLSGEDIECKTLTKFNKGYKWFITEIKDNKALGFLLRKDHYGNLALVKTFYVSINQKEQISLTYPVIWHPAYKISEFSVDKIVSIKYYQVEVLTGTYELYPIENIEITLY